MLVRKIKCYFILSDIVVGLVQECNLSGKKSGFSIDCFFNSSAERSSPNKFLSPWGSCCNSSDDSKGFKLFLFSVLLADL